MRKVFVPLLVAGLLVGCSTFMSMKPDYSALPEEAMRQVALEIETAIQKGDRQPQIADRGGVVVNEENITQAIRARAARSELINRFLDSGFGWEGINGLVYIRTSAEYKKATTRRERDTNALTIDGECADRWTIYEGIVKSSNLSPRRALPAVQRIFHEARVQVMREGQWFESESGDFTQKGMSAK